MKKLWIVLTLLTVALFTFTATACAEKTIALNEPETVEITIPGDMAIYAFAPDEDGIYRFYSTPANDGYWISSFGYLLDSNKQVITQDKTSGEHGEFQIARQLNAGETYYFGAGIANADETGSFTVALEKTGIYAKAKNKIVYTELNQPGIAEVEASSLSGELTYQWYDGEMMINGADEEAYTFPALTEARDYRCIVTDAAGNTAEVAVEARVKTGLTVTGSGGGNVAYGSDVTLSITATAEYGEDQLSYTWFENYNDEYGIFHSDELPDETGATLVLQNVTQGRDYYCVVTDINGDMADWEFYTLIPGNITMAPIGKTDRMVNAGDSVTMTVYAVSENNYPISYRWYKETESEYYYDYSLIAGENDSTCTIEHIYDDGRYICEAVNSVGNTQRVAFFVVVSDRFNAAYDGDKSFIINPEEDAELKVQTFNNIGEISYQWFRYNDMFERFVPIRGAVSASYTPSGENRSGVYQCEITDTGTGAFKRLMFFVTVAIPFSVQPVTDTELLLDVGKTAELQVNVQTDNREIYYRWFKREFDNRYDYFHDRELIEGEQTNKITITADKRCRYECIITDQYGNVSGITFEVKINTGFSVSVTETQFTVNPGDKVTLSATGNCTDGSSITYRWSHFSWTHGYRVVKESIESSLVINPAGPDNYGDYELYVYDSYGNSAYFTFYIDIDNHTIITAAGDTEHTVPPGDNVTLGVAATSDTNVFSYLWYQQIRDENGSTYYTPMLSEQQSTLELTNIQSSGYYSCRVLDDFGREQPVEFHVIVENGLTAAPLEGQDSFTVDPESTVALTVDAECDQGDLSYQWYREYKQTLEYGYYWTREIIEEATGESYTTGKMKGQENYYCQVSDAYGNCEEVCFHINLDNELTARVVNASDNIFVQPGATATMKVAADCKIGDLSYQWYRQLQQENGVWTNEKIEGATGTTYTTGGINDRVIYYCQVSDEYGSSTKAWFYIQIDSGLTAVAEEGNDVWVTEGETATLTVTASNVNGSENMSYRWEGYDNNSNTLVTEPVYEEREYVCWVTDEYENIASVRFRVGVDQTASISSTPIEAGQTATVNIQEAGTIQYFEFIPDETAYYRFSSEAEGQDPIGSIFNAGMIYLVDNGYGGPDNNFVIEYKFYAGQRYILAARYSDSSITGTFPVHIEIMEGLWSAYAYHYTADIHTDRNGSAALQVLTEHRNADLTYEWKKVPSGEVIESANGDILTLDSITQYEEYVCTVSDQYGKQIDVAFRVYVNNPDLVIENEGTTDCGAVTGGEATLQICAGGDGSNEIQYQWYRNTIIDDCLMEGETGATLTVTHGRLDDEWYYCRVTDSYGNKFDYEFRVFTVNGFSAWTNNIDLLVNAGDSVTLDAYGQCNEGSIHYQWYENAISPETMLVGEQSSRLILENVQARSTYYCRVSDDYGNTADLSILIRVWKENQLTAHALNNLNDISAEYGDTVTLTVVASCTDGDLSYQWYRYFRQDNGDGGYDWDNEIINGATGTTCTTDVINDRVDYFCVISDEYGNSGEVRFYIYVDSGLTASAEGNNEIWASEGETVTLTVTASNMNGSENIRYRWEGYDNYSNTLVTEPVDGERTYECCVTDEYENTVNVWFRVGVDQTADLSCTPITAGEPATVHITEAGTYQYFEFIPDETAYYRFYSETAGQDPHGYIFNPGMMRLTEDCYGGPDGNFLIEYELKAGQKYILAAGYYYSSMTGSFPVRIEIMEGLIHAYAYNSTNEIHIDCNGSAALQVITEHRNAELTYEWKKVPSGEIIESANEATLTIDSVTQYGEYVCTVSDQNGKQIDVTFRVYVNNPGLVIENEGTTVCSAAVGGTTALQINANGDGSNDIEYQWYRGTIAEECLMEGETAATLTVTHGSLDDEWYYCRVTDSYGNKFDYEFRVFTVNGFNAWTNSIDLLVNAGDSVTLDAYGQCNEGTIHYQWYENAISHETMLEGEQSSSLILENVQARSTYYCRVSDDYENVMDLSILVTVWKENQLTASALNNQNTFTAEPGETVPLTVEASCTDGDLSYQWYRRFRQDREDGGFEWMDEIVEGATGITFTTGEISRKTDYVCFVSDEYGNSTDVWFNIYVDSGLETHAITDMHQSAMLNEPVEFGVSATNQYDSQIQFRWTRTGYYDENYNWVPSEETVGTGNTLTVNATRGETYECEIRDGYSPDCMYFFSVEHVWDPEPVMGGTDISYEWASREQHRINTVQHQHLKCIYDSCGETKELPDIILESTAENHTIGEDGICSICHYLAEGSVSYEIGLNDDLIITGYGEITAEGIYQYMSESTRRIRISEGIARIGSGAFAGIAHELHIDFLGRKLPYIDQNAFAGTTAVCRYYHEDASWAAAGQYGGTLTWTYLPAYVEDDTYCYLVYGQNGIPGWEAMYLVYGVWQYTPVNTEQAMETTFRSREIILNQIPETVALRSPYENHWDLVKSIHFNGECATPAGEETYCINLPNGLHQYFILEIQSSALNLTVNTADIIDSVHISGSSTLTVNGNVHILTVEKSDNTGSVTIQGNVDGVNITAESNIEDVYRGKLNVTGTVRHGNVYGTGKVCIPRIGAKDENGNETDLEIDWNNMIIGEFDNVSQNSPIAENGQITIPGFTADGARYSKDNCWLHYYWQGESWRLDFQPINDMVGTGTRPEIQNLNQYKEDFSLSDVQWGGYTSLWVEYQGTDNEDAIQINGPLFSLIIFNSHVQINNPVRQVDVSDYHNANGIYSDVTINDEVIDLKLEATNGTAFQVRTGENGSVVNGHWYRRAYGFRLFGNIGSSQGIYSDNHLSVMSWREGDQTKAILPTTAEINAAAGLGAGHEAVMEVRDDSMYLDETERAAINELLASEAWRDTSELNKIVSVFSIEIADYTNIDGNMTYNGEITDLNGNEIDIVVNNPAEGNARVMRLHNENGTITADAVSDATEQDEITVSSDRFSRFIVMSDAVTRPFNANGPYTWYNGNGINSELPEQGGALSMDSIGSYEIPYEDRIEEAADPIWNLEWISGPDCFRLEGSEGNAYQRWLIPKDGGISTDLTGEIQYRICADYNGITYRGNVTITLDNTDMSDVSIGVSIAHFDPDTLTIGEWQDAGRTVMLESGEMYVIRGIAENVEFNRDDWSFGYNYNACLNDVDKYEYRQPDGTDIFQSNDLLWRVGNGAGKETSLLELRKYNSNLRIVKPLTVCIITTGWDMTLPSGLTDIEAYAFEGISARSVMIPYGCCRIGEGAFAGAANLERIYIPVTVYEIGDNAIPEGAVICTPEGSTAWHWAETNNREHIAQ